MRIEFENKFRDICLYTSFHQLNSPLIHLINAALPIFIFVNEYKTHGLGASLAVALIIYFIIWVFQFFINSIYMYSRKNITVITDHVAEIQEGAFVEETKYNKSYHFWKGVHKVAIRPGHVAVYVTPFSACVIPNRAFSSKEQREEFVALVRKKISDA